jgi:uracil-DNA glycosylase
MDVQISPSWKPVLEQEFRRDYFADLAEFVKAQYRAYRCYPPGKEIFAAFDRCGFESVKVVILGQDPYHGRGQANGLCFSVHPGIQHPPSLVNIFKELESDLGKPYPDSGDLSHWADQGVLLLNATLTVREGHAASHQNKGWEVFTDQVIRRLSEEKEGLVFLLWGGYAKKKGRIIDSSRHLVLSSGHPSPLSANRGYWFGNRHFSKTNDFLVSRGHQPISW